MTRTPARRPDRGQSGVAFYLVVVLTSMIAATALLSAGAFRALLLERPRARHSLAARWAAEGGIAKARAALAAEPGWTGGALDVGRGHAAVSVRAVPGEPTLREIVSIADFPAGAQDTIRARRRAAATVRIREGLPEIVAWRESP